MTVRRPILVAVLAGLVALAVLAVLGTGGGGSPGAGGPGEGQSPATPGASGSAAPSPSDRGGPASTAAPRDEGSSAPASGGEPEDSAAATDGRSGQQVLEVPEDTAAAAPRLPGLGRADRLRRASDAELRSPFPALQTRRDGLAPRHPLHTVAVPGAAEVESSSLSTEAGITQVGLVFRLPGSVDRALRFYRIRLGRIGFAEAERPSVATGDAASFRRRPDAVVVTAREVDRATEVTVYATLRTGG